MHARASRYVKDGIRDRFPRLPELYKRFGRPVLFPFRRNHRVVPWLRRGMKLHDKYGLSGLRFERDGVWVRDSSGTRWSYTPDLLGGGLLNLEFGETFEAPEIVIAGDVLGSDGVFVDVGAHIGLFGVSLAHSMPNRQVYAFEPVSTTYAALQRNIEKNGLADRVHAWQVALADAEGTARMTSTIQSANYLLADPRRFRRWGQEDVKVTTLDRVLLSQLDRLDLMKIDVEGMELRVLQGARGIIERLHPALLLEIEERWMDRYGYRPEDLVALLADHGYDWQPVVDGIVGRRSASLRQDLRRSRNFIFTQHNR